VSIVFAPKLFCVALLCFSLGWVQAASAARLKTRLYLNEECQILLGGRVEDPFPGLVGLGQISGKRLAQALSSRFEMRTLGIRGPIRGPEFFRQIKTPQTVAANDPFLSSAAAISFDEILSILPTDENPLPLVFRASGESRAGLEQPPVFLEWRASKTLVLTTVGVSLEEGRRIREGLRETSFEAQMTEPEKGIFQARRPLNGEDFDVQMTQAWKTFAGAIEEGGIVEASSDSVMSEGMGYVTHHPFRVDPRGESSIELLDGAYASLVTSPYFSPRLAEGGSQIVLKKRIYQPLYNHFQDLEEDSISFEAAVDRQLISQIRYYYARLSAAGIHPKTPTRGLIKLKWLYQTLGAEKQHPVPFVVDSTITFEGPVPESIPIDPPKDPHQSSF